ncbi:hypothetical protein FA95DRAFT_1607507 [Auriscalpium vulgare]|uniref:Uncharacterized protein n=1 Tax=Auriscalpium vulgare TaxID=40419 RepID=A0ACB8RPC0_9AGAM|nr:hypothetical protein FA95DRAFT_1607507 [Auriscalpium vulgare]
MATLPLDVQILIIEWVLRSSQHARIDYATLRACALVCREWTPIAQRLLFRRIPRIPSRHDHGGISLLFHVLRAHPHLAAHVRSVRVGWTLSHPVLDMTLALLELCPRVEGLSFISFVFQSFVNVAQTTRLRALYLKPTVLEVVGDEALVSSIVPMWPSVRVLLVRTNDGNGGPQVAQALPTRVPSSVQALTLPASNVRRILSPSEPLPALHHFELTDPMWVDPAWCQHLRTVGVLPQIRTLYLKGQFPPQDVLDQLVRLDSLVVTEPPEQHVTLPPLLHHFGYHYLRLGHRNVSPEFLTAALGPLSDLRLVTVTRHVGRDMQAALKGMCNARGVDFASYETPDCFPQPRHIDWI